MGYSVEAVLMVGVESDKLNSEYLDLNHPRVKEAIKEFPNLSDGEDYLIDAFELFDFLTDNVPDYYTVSAGRYDQSDYIGFELAESQVITQSFLSGELKQISEKLIEKLNSFFKKPLAEIIVYPNVI